MNVMSEARRQGARVVLFVLLVTAFSLSVRSTEEFLLNRGSTAAGVEVAFNRLVRITDFDESIFSRVEPVGLARTFVFSGGTLGRGGRFRISWSPGLAAIESYEWITILSSVQGDSAGCTSTRRAEAQRLQEQADERQEEDPASAIQLYREALVIHEACGDRQGEVSCLMGLAECHAASTEGAGVLEEAAGYYQEAARLYADIEDPGGQADALHQLALLQRTFGQYSDAIESLESARSLFEGIGDLTSASVVLYRLSTCYVRLGQYRLAIESAEESRAIGRMTGFEAVEVLASSVLGGCFAELGDMERAALEFEESERAMESLKDPSPRSEWYLPMERGWHCEILGEYSEGALWYERGLSGARAAGHARDEIAALWGLGSCLLNLGEYEDAARFSEEAVSVMVSTGNVGSLWTAHWLVARARLGIEDLEEAGWHLRKAIDEAEAIRSGLEAEEQRSSFLETARDLYVDYLRLLLEMHQPRETLQVAERSRARTFLDLVAAGPVGSLEDVGEAGIRTGVVDAAAIKHDLTEVIDRLPSNVAALEYYVTDEVAYLWLVHHGVSGEPIEVPIAGSVLREQVVAFRSVLEASATGLSEMPDEATLAMSRDLYDLLVEPIADRLEGIEHLVIVPSGPLYYLPFCALLDCPGCAGADLLGGEYLIERFSLSYAPSLTTLKYAWEAAEETAEDALFLALADPEVGDPTLPRLPDAQEEATAVAGLFNASEVYVDENATEEVIASRASSADQLLLSTHGTFNPVNPMFSHLLLSPTQESDGRLYTHEVFSLDLRTDLVTLSACETLLPALREMEDDVRAIRGANPTEEVELSEDLLVSLTAGDEIVGLTRALLYAGTPSVLASLWNVVSETTEPLMVAFYGYLQEGLSKAEALRQAQLDVMGSYPHPRYWAAFCLVGDWR